MSDLICPKCGKKHDSSEKNCMYCGENLEDLIIQYKTDRLPIKSSQPVPERRIMTKDEYERYYKKGKPLPRIHEGSTVDEVKKKRNTFLDFLFDFIDCC
ncbi:MAG: zinc-ribbon domain-containing protein [Asgard group archaeon]|nr:zinc-ribbon domain-containing protein [Asgard group archaeon]